MYQPPRRPLSTAAASPRTAQYRSNNDREEGSSPSSRRQSTYDAGTSSLAESSSDLSSSQSMDDREQAKEAHKLNQIVQQFFIKAALTIAGSRTTLPQAFNKAGQARQNKWFNLLLDESDELLGQVGDWRAIKTEDGNLPPPLILEVYVDLDDLSNKECLVVLDEDDKRWNVSEAFAEVRHSNLRPASRSSARASCLILERWEIRMDANTGNVQKEALHNVYKKAVPIFRALYSLTKHLPAWRFYRRISKQNANHPTLKLKYRILNNRPRATTPDNLDLSLYPDQGPVTEQMSFDPLQCPVGRLSMSVTYRTNCDFRVDDAESLLSSQFMGMDDKFFRPTLSERDAGGVPSSLPTARRMGTPSEDQQQKGQVYGSLATFHQFGGAAPSTSPMSALRALAEPQSYSPSQLEAHKVSAQHRLSQGSRPVLRQTESSQSNPRRTSVSFQPFKAGSLASSPSLAPGFQPPPSPSSSLGRTSGLDPLARARHRHSLSSQTLPQAAQRIPSSLSNDAAIASSGSASPRPAPINRYSSSFGHRRTRLSVGGSATRPDDDNNSSGKQSASSSARREGSGDLAEAQGGGSDESIQQQQADDDNLKDFIRLLEQKKELKSLSRTDSAARDASMRRTTAALSMYQKMRESNTALSDSLSGSQALHRSSSSSSRQLGAVPQMIPGSSISTSSSPGKPISPHTPHTPAIPSRLSANEIVDYSDMPRRSRSRGVRHHDDTLDEVDSTDTARDHGTDPMNIPSSPRAWPYVRRSSSVADQNRLLLGEDPEYFGLRSASLPGASEERADLNMTDLLQDAETLDGPTAINSPARRSNAADTPLGRRLLSNERSPYTQQGPQDDSQTLPNDNNYGATALRAFGYRQRGSGRGSPMFGAGSSNSASASASASESTSQSRQAGESRGGFSSRTSLPYRLGGEAGSRGDQDDDEPFMFTMSDIANASRRSIDDARGSIPSGSGEHPRGDGRARGGPSGWR